VLDWRVKSVALGAIPFLENRLDLRVLLDRLRRDPFFDGGSRPGGLDDSNRNLQLAVKIAGQNSKRRPEKSLDRIGVQGYHEGGESVHLAGRALPSWER